MTRPAADLIKESWTGTGTGSMVLEGAVQGFQTFAAVNNQVVSYSIEHENGSERETGLGTYTNSNLTLTRTVVTSSSAGAPAKQNFTAGIKHVRLTALALDVVENRATTDPTPTDDLSAGYVTGRSRWLNTATGNLFFCTSHAAGAATWARVNVQNAAELLTAIKTVDGAASGLDADLLGGVASASYYRSGGTDVTMLDGGTGASDAPTARANLGLAIGPGGQVQGFDALLQAIAGLPTTTADQYIYSTGSDAVALSAITSQGRSLVAAATQAAARGVIGAQVADADLDGLIAMTNPAGLLGSALQPASIASGTITPRVGAISFAGGITGNVLSVQSGGGLAISGPPLALASWATYPNTNGSIDLTAGATAGQNFVYLTGLLDGTLTATLPAASAHAGKQFIFHRLSSGNFEFQVAGKNARRGEMIWLISDGTTWQPFEHRRPAQVRLTAASNTLNYGAHSGRMVTLTAQSNLSLTLNGDYPTDANFIVSIDAAPTSRTLSFIAASDIPPGSGTPDIRAALLTPVIPAGQPYEFYLYVKQNPGGVAAEIHIYDRTSGTVVREESSGLNRTLGPPDVNSQQRNFAAGGVNWTITPFIGSIFVDNYEGAQITLTPSGVTMPDTIIAANRFATLIGRSTGTTLPYGKEVRVVEAP
jgi:hypothetical protein